MIELKNLCFSVQEDGETKEIIKDMNLTIGDDRFVVITGPNGSGKSTLAKLIAGIEKPTSGQIFFNGEDITEMSVTDRAKRGISYAFQQPVRFKGIQVKDLLKDYIDREVNASLSGGELKRIEIATLLARNTDFSLFDEPEAGIDLWSFQNLIHVFEILREQTQGSVMIISHQERIMKIADDIVVINAGKITMHGPKEAVLPVLLGGQPDEGCDNICQGGATCR